MSSQTEVLRRTSLYPEHLRRGARIVPFAGWEMPVQYTGIIDEHQAVRSRGGLFDVSHMGEIVLEGPHALEALQRLVTNDVAQLNVGRGLYTPMCYPTGGIVDDLTMFRVAPARFLLVVNAATSAQDLAWVEEHRDGAAVRDISREMALLALQGPAAEQILSRLTPAPISEMRPFDAVPEVEVAGRRVYLSRTGYTGEDGFEIGPAWGEAPAVWDALLDVGARDGIVPVGLGARDTLRLEAGFMLYGNEIDETTSPLEAPLGWTVKWEKGDFIGRDALARQRDQGPSRKLVGLTVEGRAVARRGYPLLHEGQPVGAVTSGTFSPTLQVSIAMGYVPRDLADAGRPLDVAVRGRTVPVRVTRLPFYRTRK